MTQRPSSRPAHAWAKQFASEELEYLNAIAKDYNVEQRRTRFLWKVSMFCRELFRECTDISPDETTAAGQIISYWDQSELPVDVAENLKSWETACDVITRYDEASAADYISQHFGKMERDCFDYCHHPAMQADYFRMARLISEGGLYIDADDRFSCASSPLRFNATSECTVMPLARASAAVGMLDVKQAVINPDTCKSVYFYANNAPIYAVKDSPIVVRAFERATARIRHRMNKEEIAEIHEDVGPINFTAALFEVAIERYLNNEPLDVEVKFEWPGVTMFCPMKYKTTELNWRKKVPVVWNRRMTAT